MIMIRKLEAADHTGWLPLWRGYQAFYGVTLGDDVTAATWARLLDTKEPVWGLGAFEGDRLLGIVHCVLHRSTWMTADTCYLQDLFVVAEARGLGIARRLVEAVYADADRLGARQVYWLTHTSNATARALYDKLATNGGFIVYERFAETGGN
jgi:GNAT superfamily N-acetyltransferase